MHAVQAVQASLDEFDALPPLGTDAVRCINHMNISFKCLLLFLTRVKLKNSEHIFLFFLFFGNGFHTTLQKKKYIYNFCIFLLNLKMFVCSSYVRLKFDPGYLH